MPIITTFAVDSEHTGATFEVDGITYTSIAFNATFTKSHVNRLSSSPWTKTPLADFEEVNS